MEYIMAYLLSDSDLVKAAHALNSAEEDSSDGEQGGSGIPAYLHLLLSVSDDTRARLVKDPRWLMEDHSGDGHWEEAQEAYSVFDHEDHPWLEDLYAQHGNRWGDWVESLRQIIAIAGRISA